MNLAEFLLSPEVLHATTRAAAPLILAGLGVLLAERAGVLNIGVEGMMLSGAFLSVIGTVYFGGSVVVGLLFGMAGGAIFGAILALLIVWLPANQIVVGIALNVVALGLTSFLLRLLPGAGIRLRTPAIPSVTIPLLSELPLLGAFFELPVFTWMALALVVVTWLFLYKTNLGLALRCTGESARSAYAVGINPRKMRHWALIVSGLLCALGGSALTLGWVRTFADNITLGRGFIALAAVYFGRWHPAGVLGAAVLFGAAEALAFRLPPVGGGPFYALMVPYVLTVVVLILLRKARGPADAGKPFERG